MAPWSPSKALPYQGNRRCEAIEVIARRVRSGRESRAGTAARRPRKTPWSAFAGDEAWTLDATAVDSVDAAGVQLLLALSCSARAHGATLALMDAPRCLVQAIARLGAATALAPTLTERVTTEAGSA